MRTKVAFVGAGSFVFGPSMLAQAILENRLSGLEIALVDPGTEAVEAMAALGRRMAASVGLDTRLTVHESPETALDGADFVVNCAAVQLGRRYEIDRAILQEAYPEHLLTEFGGVYGIANTLRQCALVERLAKAMVRQCPDAWLLDVANPMPRVCGMAHALGVRTVGFCSVSIVGFRKLWEIFEGREIDYPFTEARERYRVTMGGTNHLSWLVGLEDGYDGGNDLARLREIVAARNAPSKSEAWMRRTGYLPMSGDDHIQDFLPPEGLERPLESPGHGDPAERARRWETLVAAAKGEGPWEPLLEHPSWERPFDVVRAMRGEGDAEFTSLNLVNEGQIPQLPRGAFVETAATATLSGPFPNRIDLPDAVAPFARAAAEMNLLLVRAARVRSRALVDEAIDLDPTILDKTKGRTAMARCLDAHRDLIGEYRGVSP